MLIFVRPSVRPVQTCLEQSIFIILGQILREHSESTQRAIREQSVITQSIKIRVNTVGAYKYCVLFQQYPSFSLFQTQHLS